MTISYSQLKKLPVKTNDGRKLGKVIDLIIDATTLGLVQIVIKHAVFSELIISQAQIIRISEKEIIVDDNAIQTVAQEFTSPIIDSNTN
jgi:sporulation protein YlmC with PRC-barrel domain